jgi:hypothetical protein
VMATSQEPLHNVQPGCWIIRYTSYPCPILPLFKPKAQFCTLKMSWSA